MKNLLKRLLVAATLLGATACYGNTQIEQDNVFKCETDDDCITGYKCDASKFCVESRPAEVGNCEDKDGDGYGVGNPTARANCPACINKKKNGCDEDCNDNDATIHPGATELCDGEDNDCNGIKDDNVGIKGGCNEDKDCAVPDKVLQKYDDEIRSTFVTPTCDAIGGFACHFQAECNGAEATLKCEGGKLVCP